TSIHSDYLVAFSTVPHYNSWRHPVNGSWFIQSVCAIFAEHAHSETVASMLEMVQRRVSKEYGTPRNWKQMPEHVNRLVQKFYIFPGVSDEEQREERSSR
ncbi:Cell death protein 3 precursor, partial [Aphelenchoides avenae]